MIEEPTPCQITMSAESREKFAAEIASVVSEYDSGLLSE